MEVIKINLELLKTKILSLANPIFEKYGVTLHQLNFIKDFNQDLIQILLTNSNKTKLTFDKLSKIHREIFTLLEADPEVLNKFGIEVSSAGI